MKNFLLNTMVLLGLFLLLFACNKDNDSLLCTDVHPLDTKAAVVFEKSTGAQELNDQQKKDVISKSYRFLASFNSKAKQENPASVSKLISHYTIMPVALKVSDKDSVSLCVAHLSAKNKVNDGYMIFVNDSRIPYPLAYSDTGDWDFSQSNELQAFILERFQGHVTEEIKKSEEAKEDVPITKGGWIPPDHCWIIVENYETFNYANCRAGVTWKQSPKPYNWNTPSGSSAGCIAVAIGHIMAYHQHPSVGVTVDRLYGATGPFTTPFSYNWSYMKLKTKASSFDQNIMPDASAMLMIANLMAEIGWRAPLNYSSGIGSGNTANAANAFTEMGYTSTLYYSYNFPAIVNSLDANKPVFIVGGDVNGNNGHAWSIEGYESYYRYTWYQRSPDICPIAVPPPHDYEEWEYWDYVWCNWGAEGEGNGNYYSGIFSTTIGGTSHNWSYYNSMLTDITPI